MLSLMSAFCFTLTALTPNQNRLIYAFSDSLTIRYEADDILGQSGLNMTSYLRSECRQYTFFRTRILKEALIDVY